MPSGTSAPLDGQFRTAAITPVTLTTGDGYIVGGLNSYANTERLADNVAQVLDARVAFVDATFSDFGTSLVRPTQFSSADTGFYGPSFSVDGITPVPEPGAIALLTSAGIVGLLTWTRSRLRSAA